MKDYIKDCPFCGTFPHVEIILKPFGSSVCLACSKCGNRTHAIRLMSVNISHPKESVSYKQLKKLVKAWNNWHYEGVLGE